MRGAALALALVAAAGLASCGDDAEPDPATTVPGGFDAVIALEFTDGDLDGGSRQEQVSIGDKAQITVSGDVGDDIHVHGYDLYVRDGETEIVFDAIIPGTFEVELENSGRLLLRMTVS